MAMPAYATPDIPRWDSPFISTAGPIYPGGEKALVEGDVWATEDFNRYESSTEFENYGDVAISDDGQILIRQGVSSVTTSTDAGLTWTEHANLGSQQHHVAASADGRHLIAAAAAEGWAEGGDESWLINISHDAGLTWSSYESPLLTTAGGMLMETFGAVNGWNALDISDDGMTLFAVGQRYVNDAATDTLMTEQIVVSSTDGGLTWTELTDTAHEYAVIKTTADGTRAMALTERLLPDGQRTTGIAVWDSESRVWAHSDSPTTAADEASTVGFDGAALSLTLTDDGSRVIASFRDADSTSTARVFESHNFGSTWSMTGVSAGGELAVRPGGASFPSAEISEFWTTPAAYSCFGHDVHTCDRSTLNYLGAGSSLYPEFAVSADGSVIATGSAIFSLARVQEFVSIPTIGLLSISPDRGSVNGGQVVTLRGYGFTEKSTVFVAGQALDTTFVSSVELSFVTRAATSPGSVEVYVSDEGVSGNELVSEALTYTYVADPGDGGPNGGTDDGPDGGPDAGTDDGPDGGPDGDPDGGPDGGPGGGPDVVVGDPDGGPDGGPAAPNPTPFDVNAGVESPASLNPQLTAAVGLLGLVLTGVTRIFSRRKAPQL